MSDKSLELRGVTIKEDAEGKICLNDLWRLAGEPSMKTPPRWRALPTTKALIATFVDNIEKFDVMAKKEEKSAIYSKSGKGGGTYAHPVLALAFTEHMSQELAIEVKSVYLRYRAGDVTLIDEVLEKSEEARKWQGTRDASKMARERFTDVLQAHGCDGSDIGYVTNAIYVVLLGGKAGEVKKSMNLPAKANLRDNLPLKELVQTMATEVMASERIDEEGQRGRYECYDATARAAGFVRDAFDRERADRRPKGS
jgi:hypothetical protein